MSSLLMTLTLHYAKATNYGHQTTATTTTTKSALNSNKVSNLLFVRPEPLVFFFFKCEVEIKTEGAFIFCRNLNVISDR